MKYFVNESCVGCGMCAAVCPGVFSLNASGNAEAIPDDVPDVELDNAAAACADCPVGAIEENV